MERRGTEPCADKQCPLGSIPDTGQSSKSDVGELSLVSSCMVDKISSVFRSFDRQKADLVKSIGFGGLLRIPCLRNVSVDLTLWLYQRYDPRSRCLHLDGGVDLYVKDADANLILGIPFEGLDVKFMEMSFDDNARSFEHKLFGDTNSSSPSMSFLENVLTKQYGPILTPAEIDAFKIATVLFSMCYLLAPQTDHEFPTHLINNFVPEVKPEKINWADYMLWTLGRAAAHATKEFNKGRKHISIFGCSLFLQVFYLDNLKFGPMTPWHSILPRVTSYTADIMSDLIVLDYTATSDSKLLLFGNKKVRPAFEVCYTRGWKDHFNMRTQLLDISEADYLKCFEMLWEGIQLIDKFATHVHHLTGHSQYAAGETIQATAFAYLKFRSRFIDNTDNLSSKAADLIKKRNLTLYPHHIPQDGPPPYNNQMCIGTSNFQGVKRANCSNIGIGSRILQCSSQILAPPSAPELPMKKMKSGGIEHVPAHSSKVKNVTSHSDFPQSIFELNFKHEHVKWLDKLKSYVWLANNSSTNDLNSNWIVFTAPNALSIPGHVVQACLTKDSIFNVSIVDAIMVLWRYLDGKVYNHFQSRKRWRHFMPASFAELVLTGGDYLNSETIRANFIGDHITYDMEHCQKIIIPVLGPTNTWSCYVWDFKLKTISVLDPLLMNTSGAKAKRIHQSIVRKLHSAFLACKNRFFSGWDIQADDWVDIYLTDVGRRPKGVNSGLFVVQYARFFRGGNIPLNRDDIYESHQTEHRGEIMYHMINCTENLGYKPQELIENN